MSDKCKWSIAGVIVMFIANNEILSWMIVTALAYAWAWPIVREGMNLD
jgi:hypothetical protein